MCQRVFTGIIYEQADSLTYFVKISTLFCYIKYGIKCAGMISDH